MTSTLSFVVDAPSTEQVIRPVDETEFELRPAVRASGWQDRHSMHTQMTVDEAMSLIRHGDREAFAVLFDALGGPALGVVRRVLRDPAMSEEVVQEVFLEVWRTAPRFDPGRGSVATWVLTIARRRAVDRVRREQSQRDRVDATAGAPDGRDQRGVDEIATDTIEAARVRAALDELPADQREVIELAFLEGCAHGAIAERLELPLGTVKGRVRGGLKRLRAALESDAGTPIPDGVSR